MFKLRENTRTLYCYFTSDPELLANQCLLDFRLLLDDENTTATTDDICAVILRVSNEASSSLLRHLIEKFDIINFAS